MSFTSLVAGAFQYLEFLKSMRPERFAHLSPSNYYSFETHPLSSESLLKGAT